MHLCCLALAALLAPMLVPILAPNPAAAQESLYAAVLENKRYVVGAANAPSGVYRLKNDTTWSHFGWTNIRANGLSFVPERPDTVFLAAGNGVLRSMNAGQDWRITSGWEITEVQDVAVDRLEPSNVYVATAYGVWRSEDLGEEWFAPSRQVSPFFTQTIEADAARAGRVLVGGEGGLFESVDYGRTWSRVGPDVDVRDVRQSDEQPDLWMAGTGRGMLISRDGASTWAFVDGIEDVIYAVAADPANPNQLAAAGFQTGVYVSVDEGRSWRPVTDGLSTPTIHALAFDPDASGRLWIGTVGGGVYRLENGASKADYAGLDGATIWDLVFVSDRR